MTALRLIAAAASGERNLQRHWRAKRTMPTCMTLESGEGIASYRLTDTPGVTSLGFSPDGAMLVVGAAEGVFSIWDTNTHQLLATHETGGAIHDISFSPDGAMIAASTDKYELILYGVPLGSG